MFAINHASTALVLKKKYPSISIIPLLISVQLIEFLWVLFNYLGLEFTTTENVVQTVNDIHLSHMPYSHSLLSTIILALAAWLVITKWFRKPVLAWAVALGIGSHIILDLATHNFDIQLFPFGAGPKLGSGLYSIPFAGLVAETFYGVWCWYYYEGGKMLLAIIVLFNVANISMFTAMLAGPEALMANNPFLLTTVIMVQIVVTLYLVWYFSNKKYQVEA